MKQEFETRKRSFVKAVTYRIAAGIALAGISWFYTGDFFQATSITIGFTLVAFTIYYLHERIWDNIGWEVREVERKPK